MLGDVPGTRIGIRRSSFTKKDCLLTLVRTLRTLIWDSFALSLIYALTLLGSCLRAFARLLWRILFISLRCLPCTRKGVFDFRLVSEGARGPFPLIVRERFCFTLFGIAYFCSIASSLLLYMLIFDWHFCIVFDLRPLNLFRRRLHFLRTFLRAHWLGGLMHLHGIVLRLFALL